ncbi:NPCBM/NEW2 domain-containing protein [Prosthecobacter sp.]
MPASLLAWGEPHLAITRAALDVLPQWQKDTLGVELKNLGDNYCLIPDHVYTDKANAKYAAMDSQPGEVYIKKLHLPVPEQSGNLETLNYFVAKAVASLKENNIGDAARYMGTICHMLEDFGSPSHTIPGDNMFTLLQQFLPPSEKMQGLLLHGPIENGTFKVSIEGYQPRLLGTTVEEAAWRMLHRVHEGIINARSTTLPIINALNAGDEEEKLKWQLKAATFDAQVVADAMHTILCLGAQKFEDKAQEQLRSVSIATFWPEEALSLYYPQTQFAGSPHWGHARVGVVMEGGNKPVPIRLRVNENQQVVESTFKEGISPVMGKPLTWHLPKGIYKRFTVIAGLQAGIGDKGRVEFTLLGDGKPLDTLTLNGTDAAHAFNCDITSISHLQLTTTGRGLDPKSNYAVWAQPVLRR